MAPPLFQATLYELERLRCALCGAVFTAPAPPEAGTSKHDPSVGTMLALMLYGAGQPMYRMDQWQRHFGVPLPASTQWELIKTASATPALVHDALIGIGAQGRLIHHDGTTLRMHSLRQQLIQAPRRPKVRNEPAFSPPTLSRRSARIRRRSFLPATNTPVSWRSPGRPWITIRVGP